MDYSAWALEQAKALRPEATTRAWPSVQDLLAALATLRHPKAGAQIFGLDASNLAPAGHPAIAEAVVEGLLAWKEHFAKAGDVGALLDLDKAGGRLDVVGLRLTERFSLRCDPLGTRDGLAPEWLRRLEKLDDAIAGGRPLDTLAVANIGQMRATFGPRDEASLYEFVLRYETPRREAFPRELAALWSTANGVYLDDAPLLHPIQDWSYEDSGWCIGCGSTFQGSLTVAVTKKLGLLAAKVIDRDDDRVTLARYANIGAFLDALLGP